MTVIDYRKPPAEEDFAARAAELAELKLEVAAELGHMCGECLTDAHVARLLELLEEYSLPAEIEDWIHAQEAEALHQDALNGHRMLRNQIQMHAEILGWEELVRNLEAIDAELEQPDVVRVHPVESLNDDELGISEAISIEPDQMLLSPHSEVIELAPIEFDHLLDDDIELDQLPDMETIELADFDGELASVNTDDLPAFEEPEVVDEMEVDEPALAIDEEAMVRDLAVIDLAGVDFRAVEALPELPDEVVQEYQVRVAPAAAAMIRPVAKVRSEVNAHTGNSESVRRMRILAAEVQRNRLVRARLLEEEKQQLRQAGMPALVNLSANRDAPVSEFRRLVGRSQNKEVFVFAPDGNVTDAQRQQGEPVRMRTREEAKRDDPKKETAEDDLGMCKGCSGKRGCCPTDNTQDIVNEMRVAQEQRVADQANLADSFDLGSMSFA